MSETQKSFIRTLYNHLDPKWKERLRSAFPEIFYPQYLHENPTGMCGRG